MKQNQNRYSFKLCKSFVIACCLMSASAAIFSAPLPNEDDISNMLGSAKKVILYSLEPGEAGTRDVNGECVGLCYYGFSVLGQVEVSIRSRLIGQLTSWWRNPEPEEAALCFDPRHGVRIITAEKTIDFVVCFECEGVQVYVNSLAVDVTPHPTDIQRDWDRLLKNAGVQLAEPYSD